MFLIISMSEYEFFFFVSYFLYNSGWIRSDFEGKMSAELTKIMHQVYASVDLN